MATILYERLRYIGSFGFEETWGAEIIVQKLGGGLRRSILTGARAGLRSWNLAYKAVPATMDGSIQTTDTLRESRAEYLWNLFKRCKTGSEDIDRPIIINTDGKDYLVVFAEQMMSRTLFMIKLFSFQGIKLEQVTVRGVPTLEDGSLGIFGEGSIGDPREF